ncbi:hypothetical protein Hanom_Chr07g00621691 [Helianthus anomalus]
MHTSEESLKRIDGSSSKEKSQALVSVHDHVKHRIIHDDEGFNWGDYISDDGSALVAEVKERTGEEIMQEKTYREIYFADCKIQEMQEEYEEARSYKRWDNKKECYINRKGDPVVDKSKVVYDDVLPVIPLSDEFYSKKATDKDYLKKLDKIIRGVMTTSLKQRDEEKMKNSFENFVDELNKTEEECSGEKKDEEVKNEDATGNGNQEKADEKQEKSAEEDGEEKHKKVDAKLEKPVGEADVEVADIGEVVAEEQQKNEEDQKQTAEKTECKKCMETCSTCTEKDEKFRTRDMEFTKIEKVFKDKCKEMFEKEKVLIDNDEKLTQKCKVLDKENEILKEKCSAMTEECLQKEM